MMKQGGNWLLILVLLVVAFFAYRKLSDKKAASMEASSPAEQSIGVNPNGSRGAPGGKLRGGPSAENQERPQIDERETARRGGAHPPTIKEKIDPEKKRKLIQGQSVF